VAPLDGIRVLELTAAMAGPTCCMLLGDFGADVIKVEPASGDNARTWGVGRYGEDGEFSGLFLALNRNKSSVALDLKSEQGKRAIARLLPTVDVVVENFKPDVAERLGVGYEQAKAARPDVVYCSLSGFGQSGPLRDRPALDNLLQAYAGHLSVTGESDRPSVRIGPSAIDLLTGAHAAYGIVLALRERDRTGEGQRIDTSLYDSAVHLVSNYIAEATGTGTTPGKPGPYFSFLAPYGMFFARDREFYVGISNDPMYERFCRAIDRSDLLEDPRFATNAERVEHREELHRELMPYFKERDAEELVGTLLAAGIPASLVNDVAEVAEQEQAREREMIVDTGIDGVRTAGIPIKLEGTPGAIRRPPPSLGADNASLPGADAGEGDPGTAGSGESAAPPR
jgi:crotonobetainyl-CoA:carnitine CoA-transferase CaiB-like acyl-CoA transferase